MNPSPNPSPNPGPDAAANGGYSTPAPRRPVGAALPGLPGAPNASLTASDDGLDPLNPPRPRYDLPPGSRRLLTRIGALTPENGGFADTAYGNRGGIYLSQIMNAVDAPLISRWGSVLLRRLLLSSTRTPSTINGADLTASRARLLLRMGEARAARLLVQQVDTARASPRLRNAALQVFIANADPAGLCPHVPAMVYRPDHDKAWELAQAMCSAMDGDAGPATALIERARRRQSTPRIDVILAEKIVGAGANSRRSVQVQWDDVQTLTPWRFGLATTAGVAIPDMLWRTASPAMRSWAVQAPMIGVDSRLAFAASAAERGVLSSRAYVDLISYAAAGEAPADRTQDQAALLRTAFVGASATSRMTAIRALVGTNVATRYAGLVLTGRAAARIAPVETEDEELRDLLGAMFAAGLDRNAMAWVRGANVGSQAWGLLAVGSPRPLVGTDAGTVDDFAGSDTSVDGTRTRFLAAALIGLGRVDAATATTLAQDYRLGLGRQTAWSRALSAAAQRGEPGTVALLSAVGLQGRDWAQLPPDHLYHITAALRRVGLGAEARMIAAEALSRV